MTKIPTYRLQEIGERLYRLFEWSIIGFSLLIALVFAIRSIQLEQEVRMLDAKIAECNEELAIIRQKLGKRQAVAPRRFMYLRTHEEAMRMFGTKKDVRN